MIDFLLKNSKPKLIIVYSRDEMKQWYLKQTLSSHKNVKFVLGDVRDKDRLENVLNEKVDYLFHAAATKIVPTSEFNPDECIKTNIMGAMNVIDCCKKIKLKESWRYQLIKHLVLLIFMEQLNCVQINFSLLKIAMI